VGFSTSHDTVGLHGLLQGQLYFYFLIFSACEVKELTAFYRGWRIGPMMGVKAVMDDRKVFHF
jgi:hypothetical protein